MGDYGLKVSKDGQDVKTAADKNLTYSSKFDSLKAKTIDTKQITLPAASASVSGTIAHGLGYTPAYFVLVQLSSGVYVPLRYVNLFGELDARVATVVVSADTTNITITINGFVGVGDVTLTFRYWIFYNQLD